MSSTAAALSAEPALLRDVVVVGGGCYGTFYATQLERARARGAAAYRRLILVDRDPGCRAARDLPPDPARELVVRDWGVFFDEFLAAPADSGAGAEARDAIVPSPLMPHLMYEWLLRRARARWPGREIASASLQAPIGTPYDVLAPDGTRYVSFADWLCPTHCIEPAICPVIKGPRTWEMGDALADYVARLDRAAPTRGPVLFVTRHRAYGVGMFDVDSVRAGDRQVAEAGASGDPVDVLVGTISACHGAVSLLRLGPHAGPR
ncbi:MAG TPA: hypothetical protein VFS11_02915 [Gemmatimonadales bacterium]|nr:hypothetical protein [Gemmatimonadales bacterium]